MKAMSLDIGVLHFVGIGGIGMSGIAEVLHSLGYQVQGSDMAESANVKRLQAQGIKVFIGHEAGNINAPDGQPCAAIVISSAIKKGNPELEAARKAKIPVVRRAEMLAELMRLKRAVAVAGTHGKTTTTSMVGHMMESAGLDPTVINGGIVNAYGTNTRMGASDWMVVEADESDGTFTRLPATVGIITNIDPEHLDHYGTFDNVRLAYRQFIHNLPFYGFAVLCIDHPEVQSLISEITDRKVITYGFNPQADIRATNVRITLDGSTFDVSIAGRFNDGKALELKDMFLPALGDHNVLNCLSALAIAAEMGVAPALMRKGLENFTGVKRRFTQTGQVNGITIIDDYAHHPTEIETVLKTARKALTETKGRVIAVMQPHRYSRLHDLFEGFCTCFNDADCVIVTDVYAAGEAPLDGADKMHLVDGIKSHGHRDVRPLPEKAALAPMIAEIAQSGDFVILMGAGDITAWAYALPDQLEEELKKASNAA
ncbi:MAG: UDP-N-acetylmuramate--L-alanine ligase [Micavibrio sp.]|mgnify:CR=1 FL=1|nr:UDP-N-acetylmuramate--L-alanine ligase [Micavibrio sp.]